MRNYKSIRNKRVLFFCGNRLQEINSNSKSNDSLLIIDATGQNQKVIAAQINKRTENKQLYSHYDFKLIYEYLRINHNMEQKD